MDRLTILYQDKDYVAVDKPAGLLVHRSPLAPRVEEFLLQQLRRQLGRRVFPIHRLDRPTSGVLIFALGAEAARDLCGEFAARRVQKVYHGIVRGHPPDKDRIDYPLAVDGDGPPQDALTAYRRLATVELDIPVGRYATARYALLEIHPETGRHHQIRRHLHHVFHPLIGDTTHGEGRHNRLFRERFGIARLLLTASSLTFRHPQSGEIVRVAAALPGEFRQLCETFGWAPPDTATSPVADPSLPGDSTAPA